METVEKWLEQFTFKQLETTDEALLQDAAACLAQTFMGVQVGNAFIQEPMAGLSTIKIDDFQVYVESYLKATADQGLSFVAIDNETGKVVGAIACENFDPTEAPPVLEDGLAFMNHVIDYLMEMDGRFLTRIEEQTESPVLKGDLSHAFLIGVRAEWNKKHIACELVRLWLEKSKQLGFKAAFVEATNIRSQQMIANQFGFYVPIDANNQPIESVYKASEHFCHIPEHIGTACKIMMLPLAANYDI